MSDLIPGMTEIMDHIKKLEEKNKKLIELHNIATTLANTDVKELKEENEKLKKANKLLNSYNEANIKLRQEKEDEIKELKEQVIKLQQKATAWDIHNQGDWEYVSQSWDKEQCLELIKCGECKAEDFTHHETFNAEEEEEEDN